MKKSLSMKIVAGCSNQTHAQMSFNSNCIFHGTGLRTLVLQEALKLPIKLETSVVIKSGTYNRTAGTYH